jgi:hypothetical protein
MNIRAGIITRLVSSMPSRRLLGAGLATITLALAAPRADAQMGLGMMGAEMGEMLKPTTNARLLKQYGEILGLNADQKRAADELLVAYQTEFRDAVTRLEEIYQSIQEEIQSSGDFELYQTAIPSVMTKFIKKTEVINNTFMSDLKALLDNQQLARFDAVERLHRRKSAMKIGLEGMQSVDLIDTVEGLRLDPSATSAANASLEQYSIELDRELVTRDKSIRSFLDEMVKFVEDGKMPQEEPEFMQKWMKDMGEAGKRLEGINAKYVPIVRSAIPEASQAEYDAKIKLARYPSIYKRSYASRIFEAAEKMTDLDAGQTDGLKTLKDTYARDVASANDKWATALDDAKGNLPEEQRMMGGGMWMIQQDPKFIEARDARKAVDEKAIEAVKALLNETQRGKLPKKSYRPEWDFARTPGQ